MSPALPIALALLLQAAPQPAFKIIDAGINELEDGPNIARGTTFTQGETVFFSCRFDGFRVSPDKRVVIEYGFSAVDPAGVPIAEPAAGKVDAELRPQDKDWKPKIRYSVIVPPLAPSGMYKIRLTARDSGGGAVTLETPFEVRGAHAVEPSETLVIRNFGYYRGQEDAAPLAVAAYKPGDAVFARFDITGYKFADGNERDVAYTVEVTAGDGRVMLKPGPPTVDRGASFYPQRYVPCGISFQLQPNLRAGEYTVRVEAQDRIGMQTAEWKQSFRVE
jgi:hypothetical protein